MLESTYKKYEDLPLFLNAKMVAGILGVSDCSAYELMKEEGFPSMQIGHRYAKTREECQEKLKKLIEEMDREIRLITIAGESSDHRIPDGISQKKKAVMTYLSKHPEEKNKSLIARETGVDRSTVRKYYSEFIRLHETTK